MRLLSLVLLLAAAALSPAADKGVVKLESPPPAEWVTVQADPVLTTLVAPVPAKWFLLDEGADADLRTNGDGKSATFGATSDGSFRVVALAGDEMFRVKVVRATKPVPPEPGPKPPVPPAPADPLVKLLQTAYDLDTRAAEAKRSDLLDLAELYRQAGTLALDATVTTTGQLVTRVRDAAKALGVAGLAEVRKAIGGELAAVFPEDVPLTAESRKKAADTFARIKACLEQVR